jgi:hypothetical protein
MKPDDVFDCLEFALESEWESAVVDAVPEELEDALAMMERGRRLLREGLRIPVSVLEDAADDEEYRAAARNGGSIPDDVLVRMHRERETAELNIAEGTDGSL